MARSKRVAVNDAWAAFRAQPALLERLDKQEQEQELAKLKLENRTLANGINNANYYREEWRKTASAHWKELEALKNRSWWQRLFNSYS